MSETSRTICQVSDEELAAFAAGDLPQAQQRTIAAHAAACDRCTRRLRDLRAVDSVLAEFIQQPLSETVAQRVLGRVLQSAPPEAVPEILTLRETAAYLRISEDDLQDLLDELPIFELGGQLRIRTQRLRQWIEQRELSFQRNAFRTRALRIARGAWSQGMAS